MGVNITFQPSGVRVDALPGKAVLDAARRAGEPVESVCGGRMVCGKCKIKPADGKFTPQTAEELRLLSPAELADGIRLACAATPLTDAAVFIPEGSRTGRQVVLRGDASRGFPVEPAVRNYYVELVPPSGSDNTSDIGRVFAALGDAHGLDGLSVAYDALRSLHGALREGGWKLTATVRRGTEIIKFTPGLRETAYGAAFDAGTTTLAGCLCELSGGLVVAESARTNPQVAMGEDVMSRLSFVAGHADGAGRMQSVLVDALNGMLAEMVDGAGLGSVGEVDEVVVAGNTVMQQLFAGLPSGALGVAPFVPAAFAPIEFIAGEVGLKISGTGYATTMPVVGGFVGGDTSAVMATVGPLPETETVLVVDLGTNGEIVLASGGRALAASCATGPAFEGAQISSGMRASAGAVEKVVVDPDTWEVSYRVVGGKNWSVPGAKTGARGICGSGTLDLIAGMYRAGVIDETGAFVRDVEHHRLRPSARGGLEFVVCMASETASGFEVCFTQSDVRAVQLAKAAVRAGIEILMAGMGVASIDRIILAGAFGNYMDPASAIATGMFPDCGGAKVVQAGNAAGDGARAALVSLGRREFAACFAADARYVELSTHPEFQDRFMAAMAFG